MAWAYPATGETITFRPKKSTAANGGRMKGDDLIKEMFNIMLPIAELKMMMSDEVDAWIEKMAEYGQEWCEPDGRLLKCSDYPDLFELIGYNYGWSNTNPNGTYTYSFTDNNGAAKSLVIYNDLDIDGNAKAVSGTPAYFRIPNLAGRFLRCAGTASYVNKWTDTDGTVRQLLTEYKAEMYKGCLDAQRGIRGKSPFIANVLQSFGQDDLFLWKPNTFNNAMASSWEAKDQRLVFDSTTTVPAHTENVPIFINATCLLRIS